MAIKYWLQLGSRVTRFPATAIPDVMYTTRDVYFNESDIAEIEYNVMDDFPGTPNKDSPKSYTINLPPEAAPYVYIRVDAKYIKEIEMSEEKPVPVNTGGDQRTGTLDGITAQQITDVLGFGPNIDDDPDKVVNSWGFKYKGQRCGIWDYKGSHHDNAFSTFGPREIFVELFGEEVVL